MRAIHRLVSATMITLMLALAPTLVGAQDAKKPSSKANVARAITETTVNRDVFTGNESQIGAMHSVKADCSSGPIPVLRVFTPPQNGEYRFEETIYAVDRKPGDSRFVCNGKKVDAVSVHYKSKADFTGADNIVIDADFKNGTVRRFNFKITVR